MKNPLAGCAYDRVYQDLKGFSKNGDNFCKQLLSLLHQRANLEITYAEGLGKLAKKLTKVLDKMKVNYICGAWHCVSEGMKSTSDLHCKLGKAIQTEAINPTKRILDEHEKKKKAIDNVVEKAADMVVSNWRQQIKAKKKLKELTRDHEALFRDTESSQPLASPKTKKKLLRNLEKSATRLAKEDEDYYKKNLVACDNKLKWGAALENGHQYHTQMHSAVSKVDPEKDFQMLLGETAVSIEENKSEFLLTDYYEEDSTSLIEKERRQASIKTKVLRLQKDLEKALQNKRGLERMLQAYLEMPQFSDPKNHNEITEQLSETTLKVSLLQANYFKLGSILADMEQTPKPTEPWNDCISKWKEKDCVHSSVMITYPIKMKHFQQTRSTQVASETRSNSSSLPAIVNHSNPTPCLRPENGDSACTMCTALYDYQTEREDELCLKEGDVIVIHQKEDDGWWRGSINGKSGIFPATYVEEISPYPDKTLAEEATSPY
ncbi:nostrin isoform X2 [Eublepharis macularius]|uniref:Nostrin isoform X2 n=1 Tax=Eublepharis macularius TaxID=481883 RepID=A0AA97KQ53_EUBMA|nr:nostrin isoform X2 [Eublepharis macularius]